MLGLLLTLICRLDQLHNQLLARFFYIVGQDMTSYFYLISLKVIQSTVLEVFFVRLSIEEELAIFSAFDVHKGVRQLDESKKDGGGEKR